MKLGDGGEAFFVFETTDNVPAALQTSPIVSPASSPATSVSELPSLQDPPDLDLDGAQSLKNESRDPVGIPIPNDRFGSHNLGMEEITL